MKKTVDTVQHRKWEVVYEDDHTISIWRYDTKKNSAKNSLYLSPFKEDHDDQSVPPLVI